MQRFSLQFLSLTVLKVNHDMTLAFDTGCLNDGDFRTQLLEGLGKTSIKP